MSKISNILRSVSKLDLVTVNQEIKTHRQIMGFDLAKKDSETTTIQTLHNELTGSVTEVHYYSSAIRMGRNYFVQQWVDFIESCDDELIACVAAGVPLSAIKFLNPYMAERDVSKVTFVGGVLGFTQTI